jgi:GT2 family glycosyltransferase
MPTVSVIIPNYNHAAYLRQRIDSVLRQTYQDFEVILMDDCSTDDSRLIISEYANDPRMRIELNKTNSGAHSSNGGRASRWLMESMCGSRNQMITRTSVFWNDW